MTTTTPFTIQIRDLTNLDPFRAVDFFRRLLWAEAMRVEISKYLIDVPDCINVGDGGLDALIKDANPLKDDIIPTGTSGFQIKSLNLHPNQCRKELHIGNNLNNPIKPEIKRLLDIDGTYVLVLFADIPATQKARREDDIREELAILGYQNAKFRVYTADQLANFTEQYKSLVSLFNRNSIQCMPYLVWSDNADVSTPKQFVFDDERVKFMEEIHQKLNSCDEQCKIFRVVGLPGIGKTRFVFETLSSDALKYLVIYVRADEFRFNPLYYELLNNDNLSAIIVIDECNIKYHDEFARAFSGRGSRLVVFTISHDMTNVNPPTLLYRLNPLKKDSILKIISIELPSLPKDVIERLSQFADGYPRIAVSLGESYLTNKDQPEKYLYVEDEYLFNRLIAGVIDIGSDRFEKTKKVLMGLSLFSKVGYIGDLQKESKWIADQIGVSWSDFKMIVYEQKQRAIIQGEYYIYVTPFLLRLFLLKQWWEIQNFSASKFKNFVNNIPSEFRKDLLLRFFENIPYATASEQGLDFVIEILGEYNIFSDGAFLKTDLGADFFLKLTEADPESAIDCLERTVGKWGEEELLKFTTGRREVVWALEKIAVWGKLFLRAARLLLALGEAENERCANSASGVFAGLFSFGFGKLAPTEASPQDRVPVLKEALYSDSKERRILALDACDIALKTGHFVRLVGAEHQGIRREPNLWMPKTYGELFDAYIKVWQLLYERLDYLTEDEKGKVIEILFQHTSGLAQISNLSNMVIDTLINISQKPYVNKKEILPHIIKILHYDGKNLPENVRRRLEQLKDELTGTDFSSLMKRYVGMLLWEDEYDEKGKKTDTVKVQIERLAGAVIANTRLLETELNWLVTEEAQNGYAFGYELGKKDEGYPLLPQLLNAQRNAVAKSSEYFLGGYFRAVFEKNKKKWEDILDNVANDERLAQLVPNLVWRSGMSDKAAVLILNLAKQDVIKATNFGIFRYGRTVIQLSEPIFKKWIEFLISQTDTDSISIALDIYYSFYLFNKPKRKLPLQLTLRLLLHTSLFKKPDSGTRGQMDEYNWTKIAMKFIELYPRNSLKIAYKILEHFGEDGTIVEGFFSQTQEAINEITKLYPEKIWGTVTKYIGPPIDSRAFYIKEWLHGSEHTPGGEEGILPVFPSNIIWQWVEKDKEKRAWYLASFIPKTLFREEVRICWAREVLIRYGGHKDVRNELMANFSSEGWSGPGSEHYNKKKDDLLKFKENEDNENVKRWIDEYIRTIDEDIKREKIEEERRGF
jgi:hypothetical protein